MITITENAVKQLHLLLEEQRADAGSGLRIHVDKGGCAGWQYSMRIDQPADNDAVIESDGVKVIVDPESARLIDGSEVDYKDELASSGFRLKNPRAVRSCGCGTSFETAD